MIYGAPGDRNLSRLLALLPRVPVLPVPGGGRHLQQPVHVADVADAVLNAVERPAAAGHSLRRSRAGAAQLRRAAARSAPGRSAAGPASSRCRWRRWSPPRAATRLLSARPRIRAEQVQRLAEDKAFAIDDAVRDLGYAPRSFADGILAEVRALGLATGASHDRPRPRAAGPDRGAPAARPDRAARPAARPSARRCAASRRRLAGCWPAPTRRRRWAGRPDSARSTRGSGGTGLVFRTCGKAASSCWGRAAP